MAKKPAVAANAWILCFIVSAVAFHSVFILLLSPIAVLVSLVAANFWQEEGYEVRQWQRISLTLLYFVASACLVMAVLLLPSYLTFPIFVLGGTAWFIYTFGLTGKFFQAIAELHRGY